MSRQQGPWQSPRLSRTFGLATPAFMRFVLLLPLLDGGPAREEVPLLVSMN